MSAKVVAGSWSISSSSSGTSVSAGETAGVARPVTPGGGAARLGAVGEAGEVSMSEASEVSELVDGVSEAVVASDTDASSSGSMTLTITDEDESRSVVGRLDVLVPGRWRVDERGSTKSIFPE